MMIKMLFKQVINIDIVTRFLTVGRIFMVTINVEKKPAAINGHSIELEKLVSQLEENRL